MSHTQAAPHPLQASLTNLTEHSTRLTINTVTPTPPANAAPNAAPAPPPPPPLPGPPATPGQRLWVEGVVEVRVNVGLWIDEDGVPAAGVYAAYQVTA